MKYPHTADSAKNIIDSAENPTEGIRPFPATKASIPAATITTPKAVKKRKPTSIDIKISGFSSLLN
jgi:hypothetical protein